jgi:ATP-dependent helicase HrpA
MLATVLPQAIRYPEGLPIVERREELLELIAAHQVVVVAGETGSGKSTQLPKLCLELGRGEHGLIGHTQPRRIAARTIAERIAEELGSEVGATIGYAVRFTDRVGPDTRVKVMTDGILLAELQRDPSLRRYDTIIIDEAHERSLNVDFLLGYLKQLLPRRPDLKVIVTSATIDTARFAEHFDGAPVLEVSGRTYPVEVRYRPLEDAEDPDQIQAICDAVDELAAAGPGDVLVFLSGEREIRDTADALEAAVRAGTLRHTEIVPLYARLSAAEQHRVFRPHTGRRIVLATNVAETSLTVPGIRYVVDPGTARISRFNRRTKVQRLPIEAISQASANQRAGRCGRVAPGICIRLYAEDDFAGRPEFTDPEILRTNLASVILQMASLRLGDIAAFPFVEPPDHRSIADGVALLEELDALDEEGRLTPTGRRLAQLPIDPRLGRMVLEADHLGCLHEVLVIASALSIQDPRERPLEHRQRADELHARFREDGSDFVSMVNLWDHVRALQKELSSNQFRRRCKQEHLHHLRIREWQDVYGQLQGVVRGMRMKLHRGERPPVDTIHRALLAGLLSHVGMRDEEKREYVGARNARFALSRASSLAGKPPRWVMAAELVETTRLWAHAAGRIKPEWIEQTAPHLLVRSYSEPAWDARRGAATAVERATLYGLPVVVNRLVRLARLDPGLARELFLRHALVGGEWDADRYGFTARNRELLEQVGELEHRARRSDLLADDEAILRWFDERLPDSIVSVRHFDRWFRDAKPDLELTVDAVVHPDAKGVSLDDYPDEWRQGDIRLPLVYEFGPGSPTDGVTAIVPLPLLHRLDRRGFDWHVPGYRHELVTALLRSLPKQVRRHLVPAPDAARALLQEISPADGPFLDVLARAVTRRTGEPIAPSAWDLSVLPAHLRMRFHVVDERDRPVDTDADLDRLQRRLHHHLLAAIRQAGAHLEQVGLTTFPPELPREVPATWAGSPVVARPALVDEGTTVAVRVFATPGEQDQAMWAGTRRLLLLTLPSPMRALRETLTNRTKIALGHAPHAGYAELLDDCVRASVDSLLAASGGPVWDAEAFEGLRKAVAAGLGDRTVGVVAVVGRILAAKASIETRLASILSPAATASVADIHLQLARLVFDGFVSATGASRLPDVLRYLTAIERRLDKVPADPARDAAITGRLRDLEDRLVGVRRQQDVTRLRWLLEELRVSLFAQQLGTNEKVSEQRLLKEIAAASA